MAAFEEVDLTVRTLRGARTEVEGLEHDTTVAPDVPGPAELRNIPEILAELPATEVPARSPFPFWENVETRPVAVLPRTAQ